MGRDVEGCAILQQCELQRSNYDRSINWQQYQWRNKVAVGPRASIPKGPPLPHSGFVCSVNKQLRIMVNFD